MSKFSSDSPSSQRWFFPLDLLLLNILTSRIRESKSTNVTLALVKSVLWVVDLSALLSPWLSNKCVYHLSQENEDGVAEQGWGDLGSLLLRSLRAKPLTSHITPDGCLLKSLNLWTPCSLRSIYLKLNYSYFWMTFFIMLKTTFGNNMWNLYVGIAHSSWMEISPNTHRRQGLCAINCI